MKIEGGKIQRQRQRQEIETRKRGKRKRQVKGREVQRKRQKTDTRDRNKSQIVTWLLARYLPCPVVTIKMDAESVTGTV